MKKNRKRVFSLLLVALLLMTAAGCGQKKNTEETKAASGEALQTEPTSQETETVSDDTSADAAKPSEDSANAPEISGLVYESTMELTYAEGFDVYYYEGGYALIDVHESARYLVVPEKQEVPEGLEEGIVVLKQPLDTIYLAATSAMSLFDAMDSLDSIKLSGTLASGWYVENAKAAMDAGKIQFAGKYSEPDYELLIESGCDLAIESTMIQHTPKVKEMIEMLEIPVFIDRSSYEPHPLGRTEWIKLYSVLTGKEEAAAAFFEEQAKVIGELKDFPNTEKTVVYFYVSTEGSVVVRKPDDYIPRMIEIAGGRYAFADMENIQTESASVPLSMEEFYAVAVNADYLIYNASIDTPIHTMEELLAKSELFADFKAVKAGNVWGTGKSLYQATDTVGNLIRDINLMLTGGAESDMTFIHKIQ